MPTSTAASRGTSATAARSTNPFLRRLALCVALTLLNALVVAKFAGVLYAATFGNDFEQIGVSALFIALAVSLARTWYVTLANRLQ